MVISYLLLLTYFQGDDYLSDDLEFTFDPPITTKELKVELRVWFGVGDIRICAKIELIGCRNSSKHRWIES